MSANDSLNPRQEKFARLYYAGPDHLRGNGTRCYLEAYETENEDSAAVGASRLLGNDKVRARIEEIREEVAEEAKARARDWWELYPDAQRTLHQVARGEFEYEEPEELRSAVKASQEIVARCEGTPKQKHEHQIQQEPIIAYVAGPPHSPEHVPPEGSDRRRAIEARSLESDDAPDGET